MTFPEFCIKKPVFTVVLSCVLVLLGILGYSQLDVRSGPKTFHPSLSVNVQVPGASAAVIEQSVVTPLENHLQDVDNLSYMKSTSAQNYGQVNLHFKNITQEQFVIAQSQVMQAVQSTRLPSNAQAPQIQSASRNGNQVMILAVSSSHMGQHKLVDYVHNSLVNRLQQVPGVGMVRQLSTDDALRINVDPKKLVALNLTVQDIISALQENDVSISAGQVINKQQTLGINLLSKPKNIYAFQRIIIAKRQNRLIRLQDVASIGIDNTNYAGAYTFFNNSQGVGVAIIAADDANPVTLGASLRKVVGKVRLTLPPGTKIHVLFDSSILIKAAISEVFWTIIESIVLVGFVALAFLGRLRFALIPFVTIPICIVSAFIFMWLFGYSVNLVTLLALVLGIGLVVDDAIVVLENSHRNVELGLSPKKATIESMKQIVFPVIGMTISIVAVYVPMAFMRGTTATYFQQFAFSLAGAVLVSGFVALSLTPLMCSRLLTSVQSHGYDAWLDRVFNKMRAGYKKILSFLICLKWGVVVIFVLLLVAGTFLFKSLPSALSTTEYAGYAFMVVTAPDSASVAYTESFHKKILNELLKNKNVEQVISFGGGSESSGNIGQSFMRFSSPYSSYGKTVALANQLEAKFIHFSPDVNVLFAPLNVGFENHGGDASNQNAIQFYVMGFASYPKISSLSQSLVNRLKKSSMFEQVQNNLRYSDQQYNITINQDELHALGVSMADVTDAISTFFAGYRLDNGFEYGGAQYPVIVQLPVNLVKDLQVLKTIFVKNSQGDSIALSRLVTVTPSINLPQRVHINSIRTGSISVTPKPNITPGQALNEVEAVAHKVLPAGFNIGYSGRVRRLVEGQSRMSEMFGLGLIFIYLVLAALFESFIDPFIILLTVPLCIIGALALLKLIGGSVNIFSGIGLVTLIGLISKHGVLIVRFANEECEKGKSIREAVIAGAAIRLRPILMTTATMTVGAIPLLFSTGFGSNARIQIGVVVISGLIVGTIFSLFVVPVAYTLLARFKRKL